MPSPSSLLPSSTIHLPKLFLRLLGALLIGYAVAGRGFAGLGQAPVFVGEAVLAAGLLAFLAVPRLHFVFATPVGLALFVFMAWGALRTLPYLPVHGLDSLRDGVIWGYAVFAFLVATFVFRTGWLARIAGLYGAAIPWLLALLPPVLAVNFFFPTLVPAWPDPATPLLYQKSGDVCVHLAGIGAFLLLGLHRAGRTARPGDGLRESGWWLLWLVVFVLVATRNRGGLLSIAVALTVVLAAHPAAGRRFVRLAALAAATASLAVLLNVTVSGADVSRQVSPFARDISPQQIARNFVSIFSDEGVSSALKGTKEFRLRWWGDIVDYTVFGDYFFMGKGFGVNLATADGYQIDRKEKLRSPHNGHLTILARAGVPGLALWLTVHGLFAASLLRAHRRARAAGEAWWARLNLWILAYWTAFMVNGTFDPFLEGPQGGIWFWSLFGFGMAAVETQRRLARGEGGISRPAAPLRAPAG